MNRSASPSDPYIDLISRNVSTVVVKSLSPIINAMEARLRCEINAKRDKSASRCARRLRDDDGAPSDMLPPQPSAFSETMQEWLERSLASGMVPSSENLERYQTEQITREHSTTSLAASDRNRGFLGRAPSSHPSAASGRSAPACPPAAMQPQPRPPGTPPGTPPVMPCSRSRGSQNRLFSSEGSSTGVEACDRAVVFNESESEQMRGSPRLAVQLQGQEDGEVGRENEPDSDMYAVLPATVYGLPSAPLPLAVPNESEQGSQRSAPSWLDEVSVALSKFEIDSFGHESLQTLSTCQRLTTSSFLSWGWIKSCLATCTFWNLFRCLFIGLLITACSFPIALLILAADQLADQDPDLATMSICLLDVLISVGGVLCFVSFWWKRNADYLLHHIDCLLSDVEFRIAFWKAWRKGLRSNRLRHSALWLLCVCLRVLAEGQGCSLQLEGVAPLELSFLRILAFGCFSALLAIVAHHLTYTSFIMCRLVDAYSFKSAEEFKSARRLMDIWGVLESLLQRRSNELETSILCLSATISSAMIIALLMPFQASHPGASTLAALAIVIPMVLIFMSFLVGAAQVSEKCKRAPYVVNKSMRDQDLTERLCVTTFIDQTCAGFYIREIMINGAMILKMGHLSCVAILAVLSRILNSE